MIKIVFFGTPDIGLKSLEYLYNSEKIEVLAVVTQPDKPAGRGHKLQMSPIKKFAVEHGLPVFQPKSIRKEPEIQEELKKLQPDFFVTFAFGQILSQEVLDIPKYETINLHASLLPKYRGANPIQRAIINGDKGMTTTGGSSNQAAIWKSLRAFGLSKAGTAGLMGAWTAESGLRPNNLENKFEKKYGKLLDEIMGYVYSGHHPNLFLHENGLLYSNGRETPVTWMNSKAGGRPIVPRSGYIVEFNALWFNALKFYEQCLKERGNEEAQAKAARYAEEAEKLAVSFKEVFLNEYGYLLDYVDGQMMDWSVRPNQLFAIALDYSPLNVRERKGVLDICTKELVTPKGIRSLSPKSGGYTPMYVGQQAQRDQAYHQGTAWPWLMGFYLEAYLRVYKMSGVNFIERKLIGFEEELYYHCVGTIPELFDGNPRFSGRGAISFAMNVSGILRAIRLLEKYNVEED